MWRDKVVEIMPLGIVFQNNLHSANNLGEIIFFFWFIFLCLFIIIIILFSFLQRASWYFHNVPVQFLALRQFGGSTAAFLSPCFWFCVLFG